MLSLPVTASGGGGQAVTYQFVGLDRRARIADGAARDMENIAPDGLPCLTVRPPRGKLRGLENPTLLVYKNGKEILVDGAKLLIDGEAKADVAAGQKAWAVIGSRVCIWPDKLCVDTADGTVRPLGVQQEAAKATFTNSTLTLDSDSIFKKGDGVTISGCKETHNNRTVVIQEVDGKTLTVYDNVFQHGELGSEQPDDWTETDITLERVVPALDFVCEKDNRLWGTHDNAVCCCKLGDPYNWNVFNGLSTDAWETEVGSDGVFTGIAAFSSHVIAFKEHMAHKIYGQKPTAFQVQPAHIEGVKAGCEQSIVNLNETIFYLSPSGVMAYAGGIPDCVSPQLTDAYSEAAAGRLAQKYYLSARKSDGAHEMLVLDTDTGAWVREDATEVRAFAVRDGALCWITPDALWCGAGNTETLVPWRVTLGPFERVTAARQTVSRLHVLMDLPAGSRALTEIRFDDGPWLPRRRMTGTGERTFRVPFVPRRCGTFSVRLSGYGPMTLHAVTRGTREGSDQLWRSM